MAHPLQRDMDILRLQRPIGDKVTKMDLGMKISDDAKFGSCFSGLIWA
jgi:hypothetical protein